MELSEEHIVDKVIARLIEEHQGTLQNLISQAQTTRTTNLKNPSIHDSNIKEKIMELGNRRFSKPRRDSNDLYYKTDLEVCGLSDVLYTIASIIRISIMALDNSYTGDDTQVLQFHSTIRYSLDLVLQLLPVEEIECLEEIIELYILPNDTLVVEENKL